MAQKGAEDCIWKKVEESDSGLQLLTFAFSSALEVEGMVSVIDFADYLVGVAPLVILHLVVPPLNSFPTIEGQGLRLNDDSYNAPDLARLHRSMHLRKSDVMEWGLVGSSGTMPPPPTARLCGPNHSWRCIHTSRSSSTDKRSAR